jgi:putative transposase
LRDRAVYLRHEARFRGECYEADQLSIEVLAPRAQRPRRPWVTLFEDQFSRLIVGWAISLAAAQSNSPPAKL